MNGERVNKKGIMYYMDTKDWLVFDTYRYNHHDVWLSNYHQVWKFRHNIPSGFAHK